uniref:MFSD2 lysolipid transporter A, lysophospholipid a n=1 Tax=Salmo trutta TaxID=8032 RepID=A0A674EMX1_SALTR
KNGVRVGPTCERRDDSGRLSVCSKLCYAIGGAPYQITGSALGFFLQIYLLDVAQLDPFYASIILFVGRAWDAVTDPTVGFLVSRSRWTRCGRMMPWILISTPFAVLTYFLIWYVPPVEQWKVLWYLIFYCLFQSLQTCFHVPYSALTMFISMDQKERDSATAYRMTVEVLGTVVGTAIQGQIVGGAIAPCLPGDLDVLDNSNTTLLGSDVNISHISLDETKRAYLIASAVICVMYVLCAAVLFLGVREQEGTEPMSFFEGMRMVMGYGPYVKLVMGFLFTSLAFMLLEGNFALFISYTMGFRNDFQNILLVIMLSGTLSIPFWQWFLTRFGKKTAVYIGITVMPFMILIVCIESSLIVAYVVSVAAGVSVAAAFLLPWSMLPDVVDDFKVKNPDSSGHEAIFYSFYVFFTKFASGISLGISTLSLDFAGFVTRGCSQPDAVNLTLKVLVSAAPVVLIFLGLLIFKTYPIDEERRQGNRKLLQEMRDSNQDSDTELGSVV